MEPDVAPSATPQAAAASSASTADLLEKIGGLNARLERAQKEIQDLQTSDRSWVKKAGLVIGVLAGLVAIPKSREGKCAGLVRSAKNQYRVG